MERRKILIVEDDEDWSDIVSGSIQSVLKEMNRQEEFELMSANNYSQASKVLKENKFVLVSMDINLSGGISNKPEGLDLLDQIIKRNPDTCSIIVSAEKNTQYFLDGFQKYNVMRFIQKKAPWDAKELKMTTKSIILYLDALDHLNRGSWKQALDNWHQAWDVFPELKQRFNNVEILVEKATQNPITGLPGGKAVDIQLTELLQHTNREWGIIYVTVNHMKDYVEVFGHVRGNDALRAIGQFLKDQVDEDSFTGQIEDILFILLVKNSSSAIAFESKILEEFTAKLNPLLYNFIDIQKGYVNAAGKKYIIPILTLTTRRLSNDDGPFTDIHEISERGSMGMSNN